MATTEVEGPEVPVDSPVILVSRKMLQATGADDRFSVRALLSLAITGACVVLAPNPFNVIGAVFCVVTAIEVARLAWRK